jgi:hypothetical protein
MLRIRPAQMQMFGEAMQRSFQLRMLAYVRESFPSITEERSNEQILDMIAQGIDSAGRYHVGAEEDVQRYLKYVFIYGLDFDSKMEQIGEILRADFLIGSKKMDRIDQYEASLRAVVAGADNHSLPS